MNHSLKLVGLIAVVAVLGLLAAGPVRAADGRTALVIIDVQMFYFPGGALPLVHPEAAAANAARLLERFRQRGDLVSTSATMPGRGRISMRPSPRGRGRKSYPRTTPTPSRGPISWSTCGPRESPAW